MSFRLGSPPASTIEIALATARCSPLSTWEDSSRAKKSSVLLSPLERISRFGDEERQDNGKIGTSEHLVLFRDRVLAKGYWKKILGEIKQEPRAPPTTFDKKQLAKIKQERVRWENKTLKPWARASPRSEKEFRKLSD